MDFTLTCSIHTHGRALFVLFSAGWAGCDPLRRLSVSVLAGPFLPG